MAHRFVFRSNSYLSSFGFQRVFRSYTTKPDFKLLSQLRAEIQAPLSKIREALVTTNNDYAAALTWLESDLKASGQIKAAKLSSRNAPEGLVCVLGFSEFMPSCGAIVEMNCETDFVARSSYFKSLIGRVAATAMFLNQHNDTVIAEVEVAKLLETPMMAHPSDPAPLPALTIKEGIVEAVGKLGENIALRRAAIVGKELDGNIIGGGYVHGGEEGTTGKIGGIVVLRVKGKANLQITRKLARDLAKQVVGYNPRAIKVGDGLSEEEALLTQDFILGNGKVEEIIKKVGNEGNGEIEVLKFVRWEAGEGIERRENDFVGEVMKQAFVDKISGN